MNIAVAIGSYKLSDFLRLNLAQLKAIIPDAAVLVADDWSDKSGEIEAIAGEYGGAFITSMNRRGHCGGKIQSIVSGLSFAQQEGADILLVLNQRLVPIDARFREFVEKPFEDPKINVVVPGRSVASKLKQPSSKYYSGLGILTDVLAFRVGVLSPADFLKRYTDNFKFGPFSINLLPEIFMGQLLASTFQESAYISSALGDAKVENPAFLRREQSKSEDYQKLAAKHGIIGKEYDVRDWMEMTSDYMCRPVLSA